MVFKILFIIFNYFFWTPSKTSNGAISTLKVSLALFLIPFRFQKCYCHQSLLYSHTELIYLGFFFICKIFLFTTKIDSDASFFYDISVYFEVAGVYPYAIYWSEFSCQIIWCSNSRSHSLWKQTKMLYSNLLLKILRKHVYIQDKFFWVYVTNI